MYMTVSVSKSELDKTWHNHNILGSIENEVPFWLFNYLHIVHLTNDLYMLKAYKAHKLLHVLQTNWKVQVLTNTWKFQVLVNKNMW